MPLEIQPPKLSRRSAHLILQIIGAPILIAVGMVSMVGFLGSSGRAAADSNTSAVITAPLSIPKASLVDANGKAIPNGGVITTSYFTFTLTNDQTEGVVRYQLKYWNDITNSGLNDEKKAWSPTSLSGYSTSPGQLNKYVDHFTQGYGTHFLRFSACNALGNCSPFSVEPFVVTYQSPIAEAADMTAPAPSDDATTTDALTVAIKPSEDPTASAVSSPDVKDTSSSDLGDDETATNLPSGSATPAVDKSVGSDDSAKTVSTASNRVAVANTQNWNVAVDYSPESEATPQSDNPPTPVGQAMNSGIHDRAVEGASDTKKVSNVFEVLGIAWYWLLLVALAVSAVIWKVTTVYRRKYADV
ncbi:MAG: hypothetical protein ABI303_01920 [Candidatus Saccharimonas sp.]